MNNFRYSLEKVLDYRRQEENNIREKMKHLSSTYHLHRQKLEQQENSYREILLEADRKKKNSINDMRSLYRHQEFVSSSMEKQAQRTENARAEMEREREKLIKARVDCKVLDKHKETRYREFLREQKRTEQNLMDELSIIKYCHQSGGER